MRRNNRTKMYWDRGVGCWVGPISQEDIDQIESEPGNISVEEIREFDPTVEVREPDYKN